MKKQKNQIYDIKPSKRTTQGSMEKSVTSLIDAAIELITNVDDSYERLNPKNNKYKGKCRIEFKRGGRSKSSRIIFKDRAEGMSADTLFKVLSEHGKEVTAGTASRGFFSRGLIDISSIGDVNVYSIHKGKYSQAKIDYQNMQFSMLEMDKTPSKRDIDIIGHNKHGTAVEIIIPADGKISIPYFKTLKENIQNHYALRNILQRSSKDEYKGTVDVVIQEPKKESESIIYNLPKADKIESKIFTINTESGQVEASFTLYKTENPLSEGISDEYSHQGILVTGIKAVYEKSFLDSEHKNDPATSRYFGDLRCEYIEKLANEHEKYREKDQKRPAHNPICIIDSERRQGLDRNHPFVEKLFKEPRLILEKHINEDKKKQESMQNDKDLDSNIEQKMKIMDKFAKEFDQGGGNHDGKDPGKDGFKIIPSSLKIKEGETKFVTVYISKSKLSSDSTSEDEVEMVINKNDHYFLKAKRTKVKLENAPNSDDQVRAIFELTGLKEKEKIVTQLLHKALSKVCFFNVNVFIEKERNFKDDLEFEYPKNNVRINRSRKIRVFAKYPDLINEKNLDQKFDITYSNHEAIRAEDKCVFKVISGTNYAVAEINVKGLKLQEFSNLSVSVSPLKADSIVNVVEKEEEHGVYRHKIVNHFLGTNKRSAWNPGDEYLLEITTDHSLVEKYLGAKEPKGGKYPKSSTSEWMMFLNDILTEEYGNKLTTLYAKHRPETFSSVARFSRQNQIDMLVADVQRQITTFKNTLLNEIHKVDRLYDNKSQ